MNLDSAASVPLLNLQAQYLSLKQEIDQALQDVLNNQNFILGKQVALLEEEIAQYCGAGYGVGVASGTDALLLALKDAGIGPRDEVIVPAFSFIATADVVSLLGATPVFADIDPLTCNINVDLLDEHLSSSTRAIIPVHLYGQPADMGQLQNFAARYGLALIGDTAQALGARYNDTPVASLGDFGCISFFPSKNLGAYGDGGMIVTDNPASAEALRMLRSHGSRRKYHSEVLGWNSRLDELQAAILRVKLPYLDQWNQRRASIARVYTEAFSELEGVQVPVVKPGRTHVFHQYTIRTPFRDAIAKELQQSGVQSAIHYPVPLHLQTMYSHLGYKRGDLPVAEQAAREVLSLPIYPELTTSQVEHVCHAVQHAVASHSFATV